MKAIRRREFLGAAAAGGAALMMGPKSSALNLVPHYAFSAPQIVGRKRSAAPTDGP